MSLTPPELVPLARVTVTLRRPFVLDRLPSGGLRIFEVEGGRLTGERLNATVVGHANADWLRVSPEGMGTMDVRSVMRTDDGALIYVHYYGWVDLSGSGGRPLYSAPQFETGDERYRWLNQVQAIGKGHFDGSELTYDVFEVR